ncbi:MAG TPA: hypothetical protein DEA96_09770 [Leptospiraceae bacterium]|nr:hypothetical protein [Spirochaetaceae bacterium]HBS05242.1 hypothetical protein [Leptospiraceae bacterium]|tara:strand:+ start:326683 stop:327390 length:708 start_codon:yes stop_codon:yes gene_type:complete
MIFRKIQSIFCCLLIWILTGCYAHPLVQSELDSENKDGPAGLLLLLDGAVILAAVDPGYRRIFLTSATTTGELDLLGPGTPIENADAFCNVDSNNPAPLSTFKAMMHFGASSGRRGPCSTSNCSGGASEHVDWVMTPDTEYRRIDGTTIIGRTNLNAGIFPVDSTGLDAGFSATGTEYWSGMNSDWTFASLNCGLWLESTGYNGISGDPTVTFTDALAIGPTGCGSSLPLLCVEQ